MSDYLPAGAFTPEAGTVFNARTGTWEGRGSPPKLVGAEGSEAQEQ
ncbi:MAG: hypothetical protein U0791_09280 [Gemmataceae bacterium]